jgi:hypothetical protein
LFNVTLTLCCSLHYQVVKQYSLKIDQIPEYDNNYKQKPNVFEYIDSEELQKRGYKTKHKRSISLVEHTYNLPVPFNKKKQKAVVSSFFDKNEKTYYFLKKPYFDKSVLEQLNSKNKSNNLMFCYKLRQYEIIDKNRTLFSEVGIIDYTCNEYNQKLEGRAKMINKKRVESLKKKLFEHVEKNLKNPNFNYINEYENLVDDGFGKQIVDNYFKKI